MRNLALGNPDPELVPPLAKALMKLDLQPGLYGGRASALTCSITAMRDATDRLARVRAAGRRAFAVIGAAVWWVTIADDTLVRRPLGAYDRVLAGPAGAPADRGNPGRTALCPEPDGPGIRSR